MRIHRPFFSVAAFVGAALVLPGCFDSSTSPTGPGGSTDEQAVRSVFDQQSALTDPDVFVYGEPGNASSAPIATDSWYRQLVTLDKSIQVLLDYPQGEPPTASLTVQFDASGILHLHTSSGEVTKDWSDHGVRSAFFRRGNESPIHPRARGWQLVSLTGVLIQSPSTTRHINSVRIQAGDVDRTIANVTDLVPLEDLLALPPSTVALITVDTGDATDQVFLHLRHRQARVQLTGKGDGTFSARFETGFERGPRHLGVDVLSQGTLLDDTAAYDNIAWGIPYRVGPAAPAD
jgi:hypothetical protein